MKIRFTVLGVELWCLEVDGGVSLDRALQRVADEIEAEEETEEKPKKIGGGSHDGSERDLNPLYPETRLDYESWMDRPFGFHPPHPKQ